MPNLFSSLRECLGFSQIIISHSEVFLQPYRLRHLNCQGVATIERPLIIISIIYIFILQFHVLQ